MNRFKVGIVAFAVVLVAVLMFLTFYAVNPTEQAIVLQFGAPIAVETEPGLHAKIPWVQTVAYIDKRLLNVDVQNQDVSSRDGKHLTIDAFARWRISDPIRFNKRSPSKTVATQHLATILASDVRRVLGTQSFSAILSDDRARLMREVREDMNEETRELGIDVVDVRIRHADLNSSSSEEVFKRMKQELARQASEYRAEGSEISQSIKARADREATVITAEATREADILRGEGDAQKTKILADAYGQDPDFFAFYRSMQAYQDALPSGNTTIVLSPNGEFFRYFLQTQGLAAHPAAKARKR